MPDVAAIGWQHPCETLTDNGAHINEICAAAQLWSPVTWSAKTCVGEFELGRKYVVGIQWSAKQA